MNRRLAILERFELRGVVLDRYDVMTDFGKTNPGNQSYIARAYDSNSHF